MVHVTNLTPGVTTLPLRPVMAAAEVVMGVEVEVKMPPPPSPPPSLSSSLSR
jgi:hypothetical protein